MRGESCPEAPRVAGCRSIPAGYGTLRPQAAALWRASGSLGQLGLCGLGPLLDRGVYSAELREGFPEFDLAPGLEDSDDLAIPKLARVALPPEPVAPAPAHDYPPRVPLDGVATLADFDSVEINPQDPSTTEPSSYEESLRGDLSARHAPSLSEAGGPRILVRAEQERPHVPEAVLEPTWPKANFLP